MNLKLRSLVTGAALISASLLSFSAVAQERRAPAPQPDLFYNLSRETALQGTVVSYTDASSMAPLGPHVKIQTSSGVVDVHLGDARVLEAEHLTLAAGDSIKVIGEAVAFGKGSQFVARIVEKGGQSVTLRSARGFVLRPANGHAGVAASGQGGVL